MTARILRSPSIVYARPLMRCASVVTAFTLAVVACSSREFAPATGARDAGSSPDGRADTAVIDESDEDTPYALGVVADNPLFYWRLNEGSGATARDRSPNKLDGTYAGDAIARSQASLLGDNNASVRLLPGTSIDGSEDPKLAFAGTGAFSLECWLSFAAPPTAIQTILSRASESKANGYSLWLDPEGGVRAYFGRYESAGVGATASTSVSTPLVAGATYHLVAVYDGAQLAMYLDGVSGEPAASTATLTDGGYQFHIGKNDDTPGTLSARVDEVAVYPSALPQARVVAHHDLGRAGSR